MKLNPSTDSIVQKQYCVLEEIIEVELRSGRRNFVYDRTYNFVGFDKVRNFSRRGRANSRLPMKKIKSLLQKTRRVRVLVWKKIHHRRLKFIVTLKIQMV